MFCDIVNNLFHFSNGFTHSSFHQKYKYDHLIMMQTVPQDKTCFQHLINNYYVLTMSLPIYFSYDKGTKHCLWGRIECMASTLDIENICRFKNELGKDIVP